MDNDQLINQIKINKLKKDENNDFSDVLSNYDPLLDKVAQVESSGGTNTDHPVVERGIQSGAKAIGTYGLMPNTVREIANKVDPTSPTSFRESMPPMAQYPDVQALKNASDEDINQYMSNPENEKKVAALFAHNVMLNQKQDPERALVTWENGHNRPYIDQSEVDASPRVQRFRKIRDLIGNKRTEGF